MSAIVSTITRGFSTRNAIMAAIRRNHAEIGANLGSCSYPPRALVLTLAPGCAAPCACAALDYHHPIVAALTATARHDWRASCFNEL